MIISKKNYLRSLLEPNKLAAYSTISRESPVKFIARTPCNVLLRSSSASAKTSIVSPSRNLNAKKKPTIRNNSCVHLVEDNKCDNLDLTKPISLFR